MFVQVIEGHTQDPGALLERFELWNQELSASATGWLGTTGGAAQDGTGIAVVRFESEGAARANSDRSAQGEWWAETERCYDDVRFKETSDVDLWHGGGTDSAGFVQILEGHVVDGARAWTIMHEVEDSIADERPDIMGSLTARFDDGTFVEEVYFTSKAAARAGEASLSPHASELLSRWQACLDDLHFVDLDHPWLASAASD